ncbi:hypothetical protein PDTK01_33520 [Phycicoccus sp. DTK01]|nr:hypothetical protein PDTK01_33520 [Phycicoccus sp. DTK01]
MIAWTGDPAGSHEPERRPAAGASAGRRVGPGSEVVGVLAILLVLVAGLGLALTGVVLAVTLGPWPLAAGVMMTSAALAGIVAIGRGPRQASTHAPVRSAGPSSVRTLLGGSPWRQGRPRASCPGAAHRES